MKIGAEKKTQMDENDLQKYIFKKMISKNTNEKVKKERMRIILKLCIKSQK